MKSVFVLLVLLLSLFSQAQISIVSPSTDTSICRGDTIVLKYGRFAYLDNDFNNGNIGTGWSGVAANPVFNNPCVEGVVGAYLWVGGAVSSERSLQTVPYPGDVLSACTANFWMRYSKFDSIPCNSPDSTSEGVHFQYTDAANVWHDLPLPSIARIGNLSEFGPFWTFVPGSGGYWDALPKADQDSSTLYHWNEYLIPIPDSLLGSSTRFGWYQEDDDFGSWGLDEIRISCEHDSVRWNDGLSYANNIGLFDH